MPDAQSRPTVTVCTPTYQGVDRLRRTAPLLLAALGPDDEWIVAVDGSDTRPELYGSAPMRALPDSSATD